MKKLKSTLLENNVNTNIEEIKYFLTSKSNIRVSDSVNNVYSYGFYFKNADIYLTKEKELYHLKIYDKNNSAQGLNYYFHRYELNKNVLNLFNNKANGFLRIIQLR